MIVERFCRRPPPEVRTGASAPAAKPTDLPPSPPFGGAADLSAISVAAGATAEAKRVAALAERGWEYPLRRGSDNQGAAVRERTGVHQDVARSQGPHAPSNLGKGGIIINNNSDS